MALIFHIAEATEWDAAVPSGVYRRSTRGRTLDEVGFIHCSHRHQVERVANAAYRDAGRLYLLSIDPDRLGDTVLREDLADGGVESFPHLYGPLPVEAVVEVSCLEPSPAGVFVPPASWLSPKLEVAPSQIEGLGLFATMVIRAGEPVAVMGGTVLSDAEFDAYRRTVDRYSAAAIGEGFNVVQDRDDPLSRGNHSCDPNLWMTDEVTIASRRDIGAGEEATVDYALMTVDTTWSMECRCRTSLCRGAVTGADWRRPDLQARYQGHFSPFIARRISALERRGSGGG